MTREIKFRAWDNVAKKIYYGNTEQFDDMLGFRFEHFEVDANPAYMQFTGLTDKNGKDIYEEDIVKSWLQGEEDKAVIDVVRDIRDCYILDSGHAFDNSWLEFEVIGNTFENSELLKNERHFGNEKL